MTNALLYRFLVIGRNRAWASAAQGVFISEPGCYVLGYSSHEWAQTPGSEIKDQPVKWARLGDVRDARHHRACVAAWNGFATPSIEGRIPFYG